MQVGVHLDLLQHRHVQQVAQAGLVVAVQVGEPQHPLALVAVDIHVLLQEDLVLGQRAGLVGAQHVHGAEVLDGVQALDDDLLARHRERALGQVAADDHRQHLGGEAHRHRQGEQERLAPVVLGEAVDEEHQRHHHHHERIISQVNLCTPLSKLVCTALDAERAGQRRRNRCWRRS